MLQLTTEATRHLLHVRRERGLPDASGARFVGKGAGVGLTFSAGPQPGDQVVDASGIVVYVAPDVAGALEQSIIDARPENGKSVLVISRMRKAGRNGTDAGDRNDGAPDNGAPNDGAP